MLCASCAPEKANKVNWRNFLKTLGTSSSIKCTDLNDDGILDIVLGAGVNELVASDSCVVALNGKNGQVLWANAGIDQMVGTAAFMDINQDQTNDVIIGGRSAQLKAINGKNGKTIWNFKVTHHKMDAKGFMRFNFYNPQIIPDQNQDGIGEILVSNGGNLLAMEPDGSDRFPGVLAILDGSNGEIMAADVMPDKKETYMSPLIYNYKADGDATIIFGSGGELHGGHLYKTNLKALLNNDISEAIKLIKKEGHGFIAPATLADVNQDGIKDIIANWHGGESFAVDGKTHEIIWTVKIPNSELNCSPAPGDVNHDGVPDFFSQFSKGVWPKNTASVQVLIDGKTGKILHQESDGCAGFATALSYDLNNDGVSEFIYSVNDFNCTGIHLANIKHRLMVFDFANQSKKIIAPEITAKNISSTPWIGDLDGDKDLEMIYCIQANFSQIYSYFGIQISKMQLDSEVNNHPSWTSYMGAEGNGHFQ